VPVEPNAHCTCLNNLDKWRLKQSQKNTTQTMEGDTLASTQTGVPQSILKGNTCGLHKMSLLLLFIDESFQTASSTTSRHPPTLISTAPIVWTQHICPCCPQYSTEIHEIFTECVFYYVESMRVLKLAKRPYPDNGTWS
jgi:hypothetical protein